MISTPTSPRKTPPRSTRSGAGLCAAFCSGLVGLSLTIQLDAEHVERGCWRDNALPKFFDAPGGLVAAMRGKVGAGPSEFVEDRRESGAVVHERPSIVDDHRDAKGAGGMVASDTHDSKAPGEVFGETVGAENFVFRRASFVVGEVVGAALKLLDAGASCGRGVKGHCALSRLIHYEAALVGGAVEAAGLADNVFGISSHFRFWLVRASLPPTQSIYTVTVYPQEENTLFLCRERIAGFCSPNDQDQP